jgi:diguanylate cyclase (GGDEF)-like protein
MSEPTAIDLDATQAQRSKRLVQIASLVIVALLLAVPGILNRQAWAPLGPIAGGVTMMLVCLALNRRGYIDAANLILLLSATATSSALMWLSDGLRDAALLIYPVILIMAGLLVGKRVFFALLALMLCFLVALTLSTEIFRIRTNHSQSSAMQLLRDVSLILLAGGFAVWLIVNDMHRALAALKVQIAKFHASQKELTHLSQHDGLTGLPNRALGRDRIEQAISHARRQQQRVALLFVDLDNFKSINDSLGHAAGDDFLKQVAQRLVQVVRETDIVSRHGGDEFVIGLTDINEFQDVSIAAAKVLACMTQAFVVRDTEITSSCSIGIAMFPDDGDDYESLLRLSDIAMYQAKDAGRNAFRFYDQSMNANVQHNLVLVASLRAALAHHEFVLHYQPVVDLLSGRLVGCEALIRWQHPQRGLVAPGEFIAAAEKSGLIVEMGEWVLREACRQMAAWHAAGWSDCVLAVNLSPVQFLRGNVEAVVENALKHSGLRSAFLELEITESTLVQDTDKFMESLQRIKGLGVKISIDDFGTGYSNLAYLQRFAVNKLKIDQSFVRLLQHGPQDRALVHAIIQMAKSLNLTTTAEGIENEAVRQELLELGCDQGQGYYFARPLPADQFETALSGTV